MQIRRLEVERPTAEAIAPFGELLGGEVASASPSSFYDQKVTTYRPRFVSDADTEIAVCTLQRRPHAGALDGTPFQAHPGVPAAGRPAVRGGCLAPPTDSELPDLDHARAFLFDGDAAC
jgi:hypothetical protein